MVEFSSHHGVTRALDGVSLTLRQGETLAVVGESGCGKTTLARAVLGLQPTAAGSISFSPDIARKSILAEKVGMVWQDPFASLDPLWTVEKSLSEPFRLSGKPVDIDALLVSVGLDPSYRKRYPHQMSGGQRQRVAIGRALALRPPLVICDEPTAALDLSIRAQILNLLKDLQSEIKCSYLYISHDLMTVRFLADRVAVMYLGRIVEVGDAEQIFSEPHHPYTKALLDSAPSLEHIRTLPEPLPGELPDPRTRFVGCRFAGRCPRATDVCLTNDPILSQHVHGEYACHNPWSLVKPST